MLFSGGREKKDNNFKIQEASSLWVGEGGGGAAVLKYLWVLY